MGFRRHRRSLDKLIAGIKSETAEKIVISVIIIMVIAFLSGAVYSFSTNRPISIIFLQDGTMRVFLWNLSMQTHAETIVIFVYYALGAGGLLLYARAVSRPTDPRTTKYMLFFSFILILLAALGIYNGYLEKFIRP